MSQFSSRILAIYLISVGSIMLYEKSVLGTNEFINEKRTLHFKERQVLLLINGKRTLEDLMQFFKKELLMETLLKLEQDGYIQQPQYIQVEAKATAVSSIPLFYKNSSAPPIHPAKISLIKSILIEATDDYLGLFGRNLRERIKECNNEVDLKSCMSNWHMAMRESKLGRESASYLMEQIHQIVENKLLNTNTRLIN